VHFKRNRPQREGREKVNGKRRRTLKRKQAEEKATCKKENKK